MADSKKKTKPSPIVQGIGKALRIALPGSVILDPELRKEFFGSKKKNRSDKRKK